LVKAEHGRAATLDCIDDGSIYRLVKAQHDRRNTWE
jgi:hypothetical protein